MTSTLIRAGAVLALAGLATFTPALAHADSSTSTSTSTQEQVFTGWSHEQGYNRATREAENMARRGALITGYTHEQCVVLYAYARRAYFDWYDGNAAIRCTR
ncbi:hypothetical protein [Streptomyces uncialis]|uniref:hypothetical protein n=1 Tax=Streptomyces uncialis TaxID=1048205 RepID=UPI003408273C